MHVRSLIKRPISQAQFRCFSSKKESLASKFRKVNVKSTPAPKQGGGKNDIFANFAKLAQAQKSLDWMDQAKQNFQGGQKKGSTGSAGSAGSADDNPFKLGGLPFVPEIDEALKKFQDVTGQAKVGGTEVVKEEDIDKMMTNLKIALKKLGVDDQEMQNLGMGNMPDGMGTEFDHNKVVPTPKKPLTAEEKRKRDKLADEVLRENYSKEEEARFKSHSAKNAKTRRETGETVPRGNSRDWRTPAAEDDFLKEDEEEKALMAKFEAQVAKYNKVRELQKKGLRSTKDLKALQSEMEDFRDEIKQVQEQTAKFEKSGAYDLPEDPREFDPEKEKNLDEKTKKDRAAEALERREQARQLRNLTLSLESDIRMIKEDEEQSRPPKRKRGSRNNREDRTTSSVPGGSSDKS